MCYVLSISLLCFMFYGVYVLCSGANDLFAQQNKRTMLKCIHGLHQQEILQYWAQVSC